MKTGGSGVPVVAMADDFTGHGNTDLLEILGSNGGPEFVVLPGNGNGTFQIPTTNVPVLACGSIGGVFPSCSVVAGDFRRDGKFDLAITGFLSFPIVSTKVGVFLGNGDTFQPEVDYSGGGNSIVLGDANNDKIPDIITCGDGTKNVYFMLGKGDGTFGFTNTITINETTNAVAVADFNGDGNLDLAVGTPSGIAILLGNGNGTFGPEIDTSIPGGVTALAVGDFNGDGLPDLVAGNSSSNIVSELFNAKGGSFLPPNTYPVIGQVLDLAVADFNGDGIPDVAVLNDAGVGTLDVSILFGNSDGLAFLPALSFGVTNLSDTQFAIADLNGDLKPDIAVGNSLLFNGPDGIKDFSIGPVPGFPTSQLISAGQSAKFELALAALGPFVEDINLNCQLSPVASVAPPTCTLSPSTTQVDGNGIRLATVDVTVKTTAPVTTGALHHPDFPGKPIPATWTLMLLGLGWLLPRDRKLSARLAAPLLALALVSWLGCSAGGSSSHSTQDAPGTPLGTYTATITATATINGNSSQTVSHNITLTIVVQ